MKNHLKQLLNNPIFFYVLIGFIATIGLLPKLGGNYDIATYLWAEDGTVFANQAFKEGESAFLLPYAGYLLLVPRLAAYVANLFDSSALPYIFFFTWHIAPISPQRSTINPSHYLHSPTQTARFISALSLSEKTIRRN